MRAIIREVISLFHLNLGVKSITKQEKKTRGGTKTFLGYVLLSSASFKERRQRKEDKLGRRRGMGEGSISSYCGTDLQQDRKRRDGGIPLLVKAQVLVSPVLSYLVCVYMCLCHSGGESNISHQAFRVELELRINSLEGKGNIGRRSQALSSSLSLSAKKVCASLYVCVAMFCWKRITFQAPVRDAE